MDLNEIYKNMQEQQQARNEEDRRKCVHAMRRLGVRKVTATFCGSGDSGDLDDLTAFDADGKEVGLSSEDSDIFADRIYGALPGGWEINEGSEGTVEIKPNGRVVGQVGWNVMNVEYEDIGDGPDDEEEEEAV